MKKRILSILLLCCMVLTLLPTTVSAADGPMNTIPKYDVSIDVYNRTSDISIKDSRSYYIYSSVPDKLRDTWAWDKKIFIKGDKTAPHVFIDGVNIEMSPSSKGPAIELNKKASAYLYFIGRDSTLQGADGRAAIQKNRSEGQLYVLARTGTTVTCKGGHRAAGIGGSWAIRNIGDPMFNMDMYGHGVNMHFGSQSNPDYWGGTINATGGEYGAGIGAGSWGHSGYSGNAIHGGAGERLYFYSGTVNASGGRLAAGIGGGFQGRGSHIYIYGGNIDAQGGATGAGIGGGSWTTKQDMDGINAASNIVISGGRVSARGQYNCAGIGGGQYVPAHDITITGGHVSATGHYGAAIGGGRWCHGKNITITDATLNLSTLYRVTNSSASAIGFGDIVYDTEKLVTDPSIATNDQIRIGSYKGKLVQLKLEARALSRDDEYSYFWNLYETLIPDENGLIDMQLLTLPYVQNYGWAINVLEMTVIDDPCNGNHDFGWVNRQSCHVWACRNKDCQARDPAAEMSKQNGKHIPGDWGVQEKHCAVCDHLLEKDTAAPVLEVLNDGESYTVEDVIVGRPGAYTFTVSDPAKSGEASSGVKSVTINGVEQAADSFYSLPAPDGGNNDAGAEYTVVATDNAGNTSAATVKIYRRHRVRVVSPDEQTTYAEAELAHNEYLVFTIKMPDGAAVRMTDKADHSEIPYDKETGRFPVGPIDRSRTLVLEYNTEYPRVELILGRSQYFFGYNADTAEPHYLADVSRKTDKNVYSVAVQINSDVIPSHYFSSPVCYTQEELAELDAQGKIDWSEYKYPEPEPGVWIVYIPTATIDIAEYDANGSWYVYAKAENLKGTTYVSTPKLIADVEKPKAIHLSTGKELETKGEYWGDLRFRVEDALPVKVWHERYPGGNIELTFAQFKEDDLGKWAAEAAEMEQRCASLAEQASAETERLRAEIQTLTADLEYGNLSQSEYDHLGTCREELRQSEAKIAALQTMTAAQLPDFDREIAQANASIAEIKRKMANVIAYISKRAELTFSQLKMNRVEISLYDVVKSTGEVKDTFKFQYGGRRYDRLSLSEKIRAGMEVSELMKRLTGRNYPVFVDNMESVDDLANVRPTGQIIMAKCVSGAALQVKPVRPIVFAEQRAA